MTAIMERQTTKRLVPLDLLDLQGNEGLQMAMASVPPQAPAHVISTNLVIATHISRGLILVNTI